MNHALGRLSCQLGRLSARAAAPICTPIAATTTPAMGLGPGPWRPQHQQSRIAAAATQTCRFAGTGTATKKTATNGSKPKRTTVSSRDDVEEGKEDIGDGEGDPAAGPEQKARDLNQKGLDDQEADVRLRQNQVQRPWLREGADKPPAEQPDTPEPLAKGKLLTTPTRLLKLILPLPVSVEKDKDNNSKEYGRSISANDDIQPLALLIHPQQPLSYVERLIQAELPPVVEDGREKIPNIYFRAEDSASSDDAGKKGSDKQKDRDKDRSGPSSPHVASYSGLGHEAEEKRPDKDKSWVRWSSSTEMGDFIRDAARGREFAIEVEGYNIEMRVGVPSFSDRTYYMRLRLRRMSREIEELARIKQECDLLAHRSAHTLAKGGFAVLSAWWGIVYYVTFHTQFGWDLVEPVTYLAGLTTIMGGYLWFLYISRDLSYKAAMNVTVSRRQSALYESRGFDPHRWDGLTQEANALRREVKTVASEYDVDWDETKDLGGEEVKEVLDKEKKKHGRHDEDDEEAEEEEKAKMEEEEERQKGDMEAREVKGGDGGGGGGGKKGVKE